MSGTNASNPLQTKSEGRQSSLFAVARFTSADIQVTTFVPLLKIPANAIILNGYLAAKTASGAALTLSVGTSGSAASMLAATSVAAQGQTAFTGHKIAAGNFGTEVAGQVLGVTPSAANSTLLDAALVVEYIVLGRQESSES